MVSCSLPYPSWMEELSAAVTHVDELMSYLQLTDGIAPDLDSSFKLKVTRTYLDKIEKGNNNDPLLRQILPLMVENNSVIGFTTNPVNETKYMPVEGLLHKYKGRVLIMTTAVCPVHCRYCFRRHFPYDQAHASHNNWKSVINYIRADASIHEVILSGGDPLSLSNSKLATLLEHLDTIDHVDIIRIHTRFLSILPSRIDSDLLALFSRFSEKLVIVAHINHANEIDSAVKACVNQIKQRGITVFNQSVLLAGVNDSLEALLQLNKCLFKAGIIPYYLHLLDKVEGASHFLVEEEKAILLTNQMRALLPGYLIPRLVREKSGNMAKDIIHL